MVELTNDINNNHVSLRYDGVFLGAWTPGFDLNDTNVHRALISFDNGLLGVTLDSVLLFSHMVGDWSAYAGQFNFGGRTGGGRTRQVIDNFVASITEFGSNVNNVPAPAVLLMLMIGLAGVGFSRKANTASA
jgi:hypothetical protein